MAKSFLTNKPAINMTMVGFGQAGSRMADEFAAYQDTEGKSTYNCLALNSNDGDLEGLKNIPELNRVSLNLGGLGKNPEKAIEILQENEEVKEKLKSFIRDKVRPEDQLVLFFAGLGGGTGTSTIVKSIEEFYDFQNKPLIIKEFAKMKATIPAEELRKNQQKYANLALEKASEKFVKIGVIVTLPLRTDGADVLRQVNDFAQRIWKLAQNPAKGIAFVTFADNQHFYDQFKKTPVNNRNGITNYRDYGNKQIAEIFHELNTATTQGGSSITLDRTDFIRAITNHTGSLVLSKQEMPMKEVRNSDSIVDLFKKTFTENNLHAPLQLVREEDGKSFTKKVHHVGILTIIDGQKDIDGGAFLDEVKEYLHQQLPINGTVFDGYINTKNDFNATTYTFYKVDGLPERLEKGLVEEYKEYMERNSNFQYEQAEIASINSDEENNFNFDFTELGIENPFGEPEESSVEQNHSEDSGPTEEELFAALNLD